LQCRYVQQTAHRCPHDLQKRFWYAIEEISGDRDIGLTLCPHLPIFHGGALEYIFLSSCTFGEGLQTALDYQRLVGDTFHVRIAADERGTRIALNGTSNDAPQLRHSEICFVSGFINTMCAVTNGLFEPRRVCLHVDQRASRGAYEAIFGCPVEFDAAENEIWIEPSLLNAPSPHHNPDMLQMHRALAERQLAAIRRQDLIDNIRNRLLDAYQKSTSGAGDCSLECVADELGLSARWVRAELQAAGTNFRTLVRKTRFLMARKLLQRTSTSVEQVAERVGFSEPSTFCRAFREWSGTTPARYRQQHGGPQQPARGGRAG